MTNESGWLAAALAVALGMPLGASGRSDRTDAALVLAIDVSGSLDDDRFKLQREGIAVGLCQVYVFGASEGCIVGRHCAGIRRSIASISCYDCLT